VFIAQIDALIKVIVVQQVEHTSRSLLVSARSPKVLEDEDGQPVSLHHHFVDRLAHALYWSYRGAKGFTLSLNECFERLSEEFGELPNPPIGDENASGEERGDVDTDREIGRRALTAVGLRKRAKGFCRAADMQAKRHPHKDPNKRQTPRRTKTKRS